MKRVEDLRLAYQQILSKPAGPTRRYLLQSIKQQLRQLQQLSKKEEGQTSKSKLQITQTNDTNSSHLSVNSNFCSNDLIATEMLFNSSSCSDQLFQLEARIIEKQKAKFELNQNIEALEDQYLGLQETIFKKREKTKRLQKLIAKKTQEISKNSMEDVQEVIRRPSLGKKIMHFFIF